MNKGVTIIFAGWLIFVWMSGLGIISHNYINATYLVQDWNASELIVNPTEIGNLSIRTFGEIGIYVTNINVTDITPMYGRCFIDLCPPRGFNSCWGCEWNNTDCIHEAEEYYNYTFSQMAANITCYNKDTL